MPHSAALTLTQLTTMVGNAIRMRPELQNAWVVAEFSDMRISGGHCYLELLEKNNSGATVAKLRANIWNSTYRAIYNKFFNATGQAPASGMKVMVRGAVSHHNLYGISFNITDIDPSYTLGDMERLRREILMTLQRENLLQRNKTTYLPPNPQKIAVISSAGAAGFGDFCNQLASNAAGFIFYPHLFPATLQGDKTVPTILAALSKIEESIDFWDCVVIIRGGGATTELNAFDNLDLARAVAKFPIPVIVGIGHERDNTVLDYIAHTRCKTPTAVAEFFVETLRVAMQNVSSLVNNVLRYSAERINGEQRRLSAAQSMILTLANTRIETTRQKLINLRDSVVLSSASKIENQRRLLDTYPMLLQQSVKAVVANRKERLLRYQQLVDVLNPQATLKRGYSITRVNGKAVKSASELSANMQISTILADGAVISEIKTIENGK